MPGYNLHPVEDFARLQSLTCPSCLYLLKEAIQTEQGVRLCRSCFDQIIKSKDRTCHNSGLTLEPYESYHPDVAVRKEVDRLIVKCALYEKGCSWQGSVNSHETDHKSSCSVTCNNCGEVLPSIVLDQHMLEVCPFRQVTCPDCKMEMGYSQLEAHSRDHCVKRKVLCPNCQACMLHSELEDHLLKECAVQLCVVCDTKVYKDTTQPMNVHQHLSNSAEIFEHFQKLGWRQQTTMAGVQQLEENQEAMRSSIQQGRAGIAAIETDTNQRIQHLQERIQYLERAGDKGIPPEITKVIKELTEKLDQQEKAIVTLPPGGGGGYPSNQSLALSLGSSDRLQLLEKKVEDVERQTAMVKVNVSELELQLQASLASTYNGAFLWRIPDVKRRKRDAIESKITSIYSPPFYTGRNGYKMCIRAYLNGDGIGYSTHLSIFFVLMKGEYDPLLKWPFDYKVSLILVDQNHRRHIVQTFKPSPSSNSFKQPVQDMNVASGCPKFTELNVLDNEDYVKEDVMYIKCIVDTTRIFHP